MIDLPDSEIERIARLGVIERALYVFSILPRAAGKTGYAAYPDADAALNDISSVMLDATRIDRRAAQSKLRQLVDDGVYSKTTAERLMPLFGEG